MAPLLLKILNYPNIWSKYEERNENRLIIFFSYFLNKNKSKVKLLKIR